MDKRLLAILRCPVTQKGLSPVTSQTLKAVNTAISDGTLTNREGTVLTERLSAALITDDGKHFYPVHNGIPVLLEGESIDMEQLD